MVRLEIEEEIGEGKGVLTSSSITKYFIANRIGQNTEQFVEAYLLIYFHAKKFAHPPVQWRPKRLPLFSTAGEKQNFSIIFNTSLRTSYHRAYSPVQSELLSSRTSNSARGKP
jgi:hypothetical protein